jgi:hypothetical protein
MAKHSLKRVTKADKKAAIDVPTEDPKPSIDEEAANKKADELDATFGDTNIGEGEDMEDGVQKVVDQTQRPPQAVAEVPHHQSPAMSHDTGGQLQGGFDASDIKMPALKIVQGSSQLKEDFHEGTVVIGENLLLNPART